MVKLWKDEGYVEHFNKGLNEETEFIKKNTNKECGKNNK